MYSCLTLSSDTSLLFERGCGTTAALVFNTLTKNKKINRIQALFFPIKVYTSLHTHFRLGQWFSTLINKCASVCDLFSCFSNEAWAN